MNIIKYLSGKKTYVVSALTALTGLIPLIQGHHWMEALSFLLAGAFGGAIRAAVAKVEAKLPKEIQPIVDPIVNQVEGQ